VGFRAGAGILTQDLTTGLEGDLGPVVSGNFFYAVDHGNHGALLGLNIEWETHGVDVFGADLGDATTISLIPFVELRGAGMAPITPYVSLGLGANINSFDLSSAAGPFISKLDPPVTFALKVGGGADYFIDKNVALNGEIGWKYNSGDADVCSGGCGTIDWDSSVFSFLFGVRYFF
jgi:opacity protein-like surface antigen